MKNFILHSLFIIGLVIAAPDKKKESTNTKTNVRGLHPAVGVGGFNQGGFGPSIAGSIGGFPGNVGGFPVGGIVGGYPGVGVGSGHPGGVISGGHPGGIISGSRPGGIISGGHHGGVISGGHHGGVIGGGSIIQPQPARPASCRYWCRTPQGQAYCCEDNRQPAGPVGVKPGKCPDVRPSCPPVRFGTGPPQPCSNDYRCFHGNKCCFDVCLQQHVCKPEIAYG